jgi:hypothetical protein
MIYPEYAGLSQEASSLIDTYRVDPQETKNDILLRILRRSPSEEASAGPQLIDFGQGIQLPVGEKLYLYLSKPSNSSQKPDGVAEVRPDGLFVDDVKIEASRTSLLAPAMHLFQLRLGHVDAKGKPISLSAFRQWHVIRNGSLVALDKLKNPTLTRKRTSKAASVDVEALLAELGIK